jgi:hypothetical protein
MQWSDRKLRPFLAIILLSHEKTSSSPSSDSIPTPRKTTFENSYKNLRYPTVGLKVKPILAVILVWREQTSSSPSKDSIPSPRKMASRNSSEN